MNNESRHSIDGHDVRVVAYGDDVFGCFANVGGTGYNVLYREGVVAGGGSVQGVAYEDQLKPMPQVPADLYPVFEKAIAERKAQSS